MKSLLVFISIFIFTIGFEARPQTLEKFYVYQSEIAKDGTIINETCYKSSVVIKNNRQFIEIKTDSIDFKCYVIKKDNYIIDDGITISLVAAKSDQVFYIREFSRDEKYFLTIIPVKLSLHNTNLGGYGLRMLISNELTICGSIKLEK